MPKRKKVPLPEDGADEIHRKRRRGNADLGDIFQTLYSAMQTCKSEDGRVLCETFIRAPKKRVQADYYDVVATPMDLLTIHQKIKSSEYTELDQLTADVELMVNNTKAYYKEGSQEFKDAEEMWEAYQTAKTNLLSTRAKEEEMESMELDGGSLTGAVSDSTDEDHYEELFTSVMTAADAEGRCISSMFQLLPSRTLYPEYYKIITEPIDLKLIATKIQDSAYTNLGELEKDLMLLIRNAKTFNEPGSQIYKDATQLKKAVRIKKAEIDQRRNAPGKCSERIRSKRIMASQKLSAITAALKYEDNEPPITVAATRVSLPEGTAVSAADESDDDSGAPEDVDNSPMWQLLETVRTYQSQGYFLAEPFTKLPSKRLYPDYYREIRQPISLNKIAAKIKDEVYSCTMDTVDDLNLLFENAKRYNRPDSKIFKDAVKLQKVMQAKARELLNCNIKIPESDSEGEVEEKVKRKSKKVVTPVSARRGPKPQEDLVLKKRLKALIRSLVNYADDSGRPLISIFMERPSKRDYPDYYEVISNPIDMRTIEENAKSNKYMTEEAMISDLRLMFNNCRLYNEEGSQIYQDADTLERVLNEKIKELGPPGDSRTPRTMPRRNKGRNYKLRVLYDTIKEYTDAKGRRLSTIFMKLPSRAEYPDYYEVIKKPIDLERIATRLLKHNQYESLDDLLADFNLLFDNACKYNEPDSQIYKDALTLQRIVLQTKLELSSEEMEDGGVPDVRTLVQEMLTNLFISVYNHQDDEGRCYSDSIVELSETASDGAGAPEERKLLTLDIIKRRLDRGCYVRLDRFQEDMFEVFERARRVSRTDSQAFEDSVELQSYFIKLRDELCGMGDVLQSPALNYASQDLAESVEAMKAQKLPQEQQEAAAEQTTQEEQKEVQRNNEASSSDSTEHRGIVIHVGDFVYVEPREKGMEPHITSVDRLWRDKSGEQWLYGCWFYRPNETFHLASRKFLEKELFKSDNYNSTPVNQVLGKCYVMPVKDYFKSYPKGFDDKDVYVCESRYSAKAKAFKKIKIWNFVFNEHTQLVPREELLSAVRVPSVFKDGVDKLGEDEEELKLVEKPRANVSLPPANDDEIAVYYEQLNLPSGVYKLGDCCYVRTEHSKTLIGRIDKMWMDKDGNGFYHGPWFVTPSEIQHQPSRTFYRQEVFLSSIEDTNPLLSIVGRCSVLDYKDYTTCRLTEINEQDIYICESRYMEAERQIRKLPKGLKKFLHSDAVTADEVYYFKHSITPQKIEPTPEPETVPTTDEMSPNMSRVTSETDNEESNDVPSSSLGRDENSNLSSASGKKKSSKRLVTGYLLFAGEIRKSIVAANPDKSFGDISRLVGNEWRNLQPSQKVDFEERAQRVNEDANSMDSLPQSPASSACGEGSRDGGPRTPGGGADLPTLSTTVYECLWDTCEAQYETQQELVDHLAQEPNGHVYQSYLGFKDNNEFQCLWPNCARVKKNVPPFPNIQKLLRHVREVHVKTAGKIIMPDVKARSFTPSKKGVASPAPAAMPPSTPVSHHHLHHQQLSAPSPMHLVPPMPHHPGIGAATHGTPNYGTPPPPPPPHFVPGANSPYMSAQPHLRVQGASMGQPGAAAPAPPERTLEPIFVAPPPLPHKLLHTYTYIKYIESLQSDSKHVSNWDTQLKATKDNTPVYDASRLPTHWLGNGVGGHGNAVNALWALRDFMLRDALNISRIS